MDLALVSSPSRRTLLEMIKRQGSLSLDEAVATTGLSRTTVREHLLKLEDDGLVERTMERQKRGRPSHRYSLTTRGDRLFPVRDGLLLRELVAFLEQQGRKDLVEAFLDRFWEARLEEALWQMDGAAPAGGPERLAVLESILREQGFMPDVLAAGDEIVVRECNCPFPDTIRATRLPCRLEARFFERLLNKPMRRVTYVPDGHDACTYTFLSGPAGQS